LRGALARRSNLDPTSAQRTGRPSGRPIRSRSSDYGKIYKVVVVATAAAFCTIADALAQGVGRPSDYATMVQQICRQYAAAQHALPYETMYAQCMFARGLRVPGFSPSPDSPGYQGELLGPPAHNGGY
jgi:hypothetical protein